MTDAQKEREAIVAWLRVNKNLLLTSSISFICTALFHQGYEATSVFVLSCMLMIAGESLDKRIGEG